MLYIHGIDYVFRSFSDLETAIYETKQLHGVGISKRMREHFVRDWSDHPAMDRLGMTPIKPIAILSIPQFTKVTGNAVVLAIECEEGMITEEEMILSSRDPDQMPTQSEIQERAKAIRDGHVGPGVTYERAFWGYEGPGIRECAVLTNRYALAD